MRSIIRTGDGAPDVATLQQALHALDPAALVDLEPGGGAVRIATCLTDGELARVVRQAGNGMLSAPERLPSECCGGCGG